MNASTKFGNISVSEKAEIVVGNMIVHTVITPNKLKHKIDFFFLGSSREAPSVLSVLAEEK